MSLLLMQLALFTAKALIIVFIILVILFAFFAMLVKGKMKPKERLIIKNLNHKYLETTEGILAETQSKKVYKQFLKEQKAHDKAEAKAEIPAKNIYVINFNGDVRASAVCSLREEITAILNVATTHDEVIVKLESGGGMVHAYGLGAAQLMRLRSHGIPLTVTIDKIAASGGYMMACIANKILAAPFAIVGSIGVVVQLPNFHRALKDKNIDFELHTAGEFKRTITLFGENTDEGREKLQHEIENIHQQFKNLISEHRPALDINQVATGEHWMGQQALQLKLVDEIKTSDDYLLERSKEAHLYEISYEIKKSFFSKFSGSANNFKESLLKKW